MKIKIPRRVHSFSSKPFFFLIQFRVMKNFNQIFPTDIITDILSFLPAESLLECKSVCKTWKDLIENPSFPRLQLARLDSTDSGKLSYVFLKSDDVYLEYDFYYFEYNDNEDWNYVKPNHRKINLEIPLESYIFIGSFNGLICVYGTRLFMLDASGPAIVFNPVTREYVVLPDFDSYPEYETKGKNSIQCCHFACGFGYLVETDEYKVVRIYRKLSGELLRFVEVEVYTLGSGKGWRHVGKFDFGFAFYTDCDHIHGVFLNGCLHWRNTEGGMVLVFDLVNEKFRDHIPPPPMLTGTDDDDYEDCQIVIGVSGGGILYYAVHQSVQDQEFDNVWLLTNNHVMTERIEHQSWGWSKATSLKTREPFAFKEGGSNVVRLAQGIFKTFFPRTSTWQAILNSDVSRQVFRYKHTLLSLKELGEEDTEIMESREMEKTDNSESGSD